jgi:hypothetical protein
MKKTVIFILLCVSVFVLKADNEDNSDKPWDFFGVVFLPGTPSSSDETNVGGFRVGLPVSGGKGEVAGIEFAAFACWSKDVTGIQTAPLFCVADSITGLQASPVTIADKADGVQFGIVNISDSAFLQLGIVNYMKDGFLPYTILFNFR